MARFFVDETALDSLSIPWVYFIYLLRHLSTTGNSRSMLQRRTDW